jgi:hypothetical protein
MKFEESGFGWDNKERLYQCSSDSIIVFSAYLFHGGVGKDADTIFHRIDDSSADVVRGAVHREWKLFSYLEAPKKFHFKVDVKDAPASFDNEIARILFNNIGSDTRFYNSYDYRA